MHMRSLASTFVFGSLLAFGASSALADARGSNNYGDFSGVDFDFLNVWEDSTTGHALPLFGAPTAVGNSLDFNPTFSAFSSGGGLEVVEGQLNFGILATNSNAFIDTLVFAESGDYSLIDPGGLGSAATFASVSAAFFIEVFEVDGVPLVSPIGGAFNMVFTPSDGSFNLVDDGTASTQIWNGFLEIDVWQMLQDAGISGNATMVQIALNNTLVANSEDGTASLIAKKDFDGLVVTVIPAPGAMMLLGLAGILATGRRRRA